jgi:hypothetical protein
MSGAAIYGIPERLYKEVKLKTITALNRELLNDYELHLYRGQADESWPINTRLHRTFKRDWLLNERRIRQVFESDFEMHNEGGIKRPISRFDWDAIMQHYGAPTRLLDWTQSPYIALYFAVTQHEDKDGAIWRLDSEWARAASRKIISRSVPPMTRSHAPAFQVYDVILEHKLKVALPIIPSSRFRRMSMQAGHFLVVGGESADFLQVTQLLAQEAREELPRKGHVLKRIVIDANLKLQCKRILDAMAINEGTIYPGLEGLARSTVTRQFTDWSRS